MNVFDYFQRQFNTPPQDGTLRELPIESPCGIECQQAIDAMKTYLDKAVMARGDDAAWSLLDDLNHTIEIFWRG